MRRRNAIPRNEMEAFAQERALAALALMRRDKLSLSAAAKVQGIGSSVVRRYVGSALQQSGPGRRFRAKPYDRIPRTLNFLTPQGRQGVTVRDSRTASAIGEYMNAVRAYLGGDGSTLADFEGRSFRADGVIYEFVTNPRTLSHVGDAGDLAIEGLYRSVHGKGQ